jgi:hypothetical protein
MKKEKLILSVIAVVFGLLVAGCGLYFFRAAKTNPNANTKTISFTSPTPTSPPSISLKLNQPKDEEVVSSKSLVVSGKTQGNAIVVIVTDSSQDVVTPSSDGEFSTTVDLDEGQNTLEITAIAPNGESVSDKMTVTFSQEEF